MTRLRLVRDASPRIRFARGTAAKDASLHLYAILDGESCQRRGLNLFWVAAAWRDAGVRLIQYRDKLASKQQVIERALRLRDLFPEGDDGLSILILNDHADLVRPTGFDGVHVGQTDAAIAEARALVGDDRIVGVSTHSADQAMAAGETDADYIAIGPVYGTTTKLDAEPPVGLCGVQATRAVTRKPLVAIGGIGLEQAREVRAAGADSVAVISGLLAEEQDPAAFTQLGQDFLRRLK